jgi:hypothetical protein
VDIFPKPPETKYFDIKRLICEHSTSLEEKIITSQIRITVHCFDQIQDPFVVSAGEKMNFSLAEEEEY